MQIQKFNAFFKAREISYNLVVCCKVKVQGHSHLHVFLNKC